MGMPCGKYLTVMLPLWLPLLDEAGDLDKPFATPATISELEAMSAATIDRYLAPARKTMQLRGISTTVPAPAVLRNSIGLSKVGDAPPATPGVIEADTVAHCGPTFAGEFARTLTMTDLVTGWTENASIRNTAAELLHPDQETARVLHHRGRAPTPRLRQARDPVAARARLRHPHRRADHQRRRADRGRQPGRPDPADQQDPTPPDRTIPTQDQGHGRIPRARYDILETVDPSTHNNQMNRKPRTHNP
jgi:hypothetical protein